MSKSLRLNAPTKPVFLISLAIAIVAVAGYFVLIPFVTVNGFWIAIAAYVVLAVACAMKNM